MAVGGAIGAAFLIVGIRIAIRLAANYGYDAIRSATASPSQASFNTSSGTNPLESEMGDPASTTRAVMNSLHNLDWHSFYYLTAFESSEDKSGSNAASFSSEVSRLIGANLNGQAFEQLMTQMHDISIGQGSSSSATSDVTTSSSSSYQGKQYRLSGVAHLIKLNNHWYLNMIKGPGQVTQNAFADLIGVGNLRTTGGDLLFPGGAGFFAPPNIAMPTPPIIRPPAFNQPGFQPNGGGYGYNPPGANSNGMPPNPAFGQNGYTGGQNGMPPQPQMGGPRFGPQFGPRFGPGQTPGAGPGFGNPAYRGPRFGQQGSSGPQFGAPQSGGSNSAGEDAQNGAAGQPPPGGPDNSGTDRRGGF